MKFILGTLGIALILLNQNYKPNNHPKVKVESKLDTLVDYRDENSYEIIKVDSIWWFNQNLNFETSDSYCFQDKEENCNLLGRLYPFEEAKNSCPKGWRLPSNKDFDHLLQKLSANDNYGIIYLESSWENINQENKIGFRFQKTGFKHKRKYKAKSSLNFWLQNNETGFHAHIYKEKKSDKMVVFRHNHEKHNPILHKRKFAVRCVCESSCK